MKAKFRGKNLKEIELTYLLPTMGRRQAKESLQVQNDIAEIKLMAERRIGEFSRELPKSESGRPAKNSPHDGESKTSILTAAGITHCERYEAIASLPDKMFEKHIPMVFRDGEVNPSINFVIRI